MMILLTILNKDPYSKYVFFCYLKYIFIAKQKYVSRRNSSSLLLRESVIFLYTLYTLRISSNATYSD